MVTCRVQDGDGYGSGILGTGVVLVLGSGVLAVVELVEG